MDKVYTRRTMRYYSIMYMETDGTEDFVSVRAESLSKALAKVAKWFPDLEPLDVIDHGEL